MVQTKQRQIYANTAGAAKETQEFVTIGTVVDTNDPQQMGRVRVVCPAWGDSYSTPIDTLPWALYVTPFGGQTAVGTRGPGIQKSEGGISYGMWAPPKVGAQALVLCVDGDPQHRVFFGCVYDLFTPHTMPHGRWKYDDHPDLAKAGSDPKPFGPYTSRDGFVEPLAENIREAFGSKTEPNFEWRTRAADYQVSAVDVSQVNYTRGNAPDDKQITHDGWESTQGYQVSRIDPDAPVTDTDKNYDNMVYSWTTPGFHAISMDDRQENCRIRFRTTSGNQIILDDTNERIYIQTAKGRNWIEMDQNGNIDIFTTNKLNVHATKDINFTSDETIRMHAKKGIHMYSGDEIRMQSTKDIHIKTDMNVRANAGQSFYVNATTDLHVKAGAALYLTSGSDAHISAGAALYAAAAADIHHKAGGNVNIDGATVNLNGGGAGSASSASPPAEQPSMWTNRVPQHEPWARTMTKADFTHDPELPYDDKNVGRVERGVTTERGRYWRR